LSQLTYPMLNSNSTKSKIWEIFSRRST